MHPFVCHCEPVVFLFLVLQTLNLSVENLILGWRFIQFPETTDQD